MRWLRYTFLALFSLGMLGLIGVAGVSVYVISYYSQDLPDYTALKDYEPPIVSRLYAGDGHLLAEFAQEKRVFVPIDVVPPRVKNAFIAAEDKNFYSHKGVDYLAVTRAMVSNLKNIGSNRRLVGASTITQQVAKNFLLTNEVSYKRKIREAILAFRMERAMSKDRLLELYLNEIYLGQHSYGIAAASLNYFNKSLEELSIEEAAYLAALPKAPNNYHPVRHYDRAVTRRNWVIGQMRSNNFITKGQAEIAKIKPLQIKSLDTSRYVNAPYFAEEVRRELKQTYGDDSLYGGGLVVRTSVDPHLQDIARRTLQDGIVEYDRRHGWRGALDNLKDMSDWQEQIAAYKRLENMPPEWSLGVVLKVTDGGATVGLQNEQKIQLQKKYLKWAKKALKNQKVGAAITSAKQVLKTGDIIMVSQVEIEEKGKDNKAEQKTVWGLRQIPAVNGGIIAMDPHTGRVLAMQGGWSFNDSEFNRATQAKRQPGSAFKPFVYLSALNKGFTPATLVLDAPIVIDQGPGLPKWSPSNYSNEYYGPTPVRIGIEKSRNLMTVRLAEYVGIEEIAKYAQKFGVIDNMPPLMSYSLGAGETTLLKLTTGYAQIINGGKKITPTLIDRIQDRRGKTIFSHDIRNCRGCGPLIEWKSQDTPEVPDTREQLADPRHAYQIVSMLEGVVKRGTGIKINALGRPLAGKTGTTNESRDTWFIGFSPDFVVGVFIGFDNPRPMGKKETGSSVAVPVFKAFMKEALKDTPPTPFRIPPGIRNVQINAENGTRAQMGDKKVIWEAFLAGTEPTDKIYILDGTGISIIPESSMRNKYNGENFNPVMTTGTGGIY